MPIHKKKTTENVWKTTALSRNYQSVAKSLMKCCLFIKNGLILQIQSGFKFGDSYVNQFLSISHEIYKQLGDEFDARRVFLDTSMAFYKV